MNRYPHLPKGHTSVLSPQFRYVPAEFTNLAATFARVRGELLQPQKAPVEGAQRDRLADEVPEFGIEVLEATWFASRPAWPREHR